MSDFPRNQIAWPVTSNVISPMQAMQPCAFGGKDPGVGTATAGAWTLANRAIYMPFLLDQPVTATKAFLYVGAAAGNIDIAVIRSDKKRIVSSGTVAVPAVTDAPAVIDITDTVLSPGQYWIGVVASSTSLTVYQSTLLGAAAQATGTATADLGATTIPDPVTFATPIGVGRYPVMGLYTGIML